MNDISLLEKNEKEMKIIIHTLRIYSQDFRIEFGRYKYAMLITRSGKRQITDGIEP